MILTLTSIYAFLFGAIIGSFLNVVIHRVPRGLSVVSPPSSCPGCQTRIRWYDNIPIVSWLVLGGKCRQCKEPISWRYAAVEALVGLCSGFLWLKIAATPLSQAASWVDVSWHPLVVPYLMYFTFMCLLISIAFIDLEHLIIPHELALPGILIGLATPWVIDALYGAEGVYQHWPPITPMTSIIGALAGALCVITIMVLYFMLRGIVGMGGGDVTLMAMLGAWLGWPALLFIFFASSIQGLAAVGINALVGGNLVHDARDLFDDPQEEVALAQAAESERDAVIATDLAGEERADAALNTARQGEDGTAQEAGPAAIPFGPFLVLSGLEFLLFGSMMPPSLSMLYLY